nr:copia protein [Tanacetum cinerariifolium]
MKIIGTKWVFRNKLDENDVVSRNKARLVAQGYNQQKDIDYDETYSPVARLESIRILLAYACTLDFKLFQMDVNSGFLNGFINEEAYLAQPLGFIDFKKPDHVYQQKNALYGLKQASKAWGQYTIVMSSGSCKTELVPQLRNMKIIGTKWVFRNMLDENDVVSRNKARLVAQSYNQQEDIDYDETYSPVARLESIRILLAYACTLDFKLFQMDVNSGFLNGFINEEVYLAQPLGFVDFKKPDHVYQQKNALYGLKQASKAWNDGAHSIDLLLFLLSRF